jgi:nitrogen fixation protein FixH
MSASFWRLLPAGLIVTMVSGLGFMAWIAVHDPSFAVEQDYYRKAVAWDETRAQEEQNARLGWKVDLDVTPRGDQLLLRARVSDASGTPIPDARVDVEAFANARASRVLHATLLPEEGEQAGAVPLVQPGLWEVRLTVVAHGERFTEVVRKLVRPGGPS